MIFNSEEELIAYHKMVSLPSCSMAIYRLNSDGSIIDDGGITLEVQVPGYMTEEVQGRDSLETDVKELTYPHVDGAKYRSKTQKTRDITVKYHLVSFDPETHRKKLAKLRSILFGKEHEYCVFRFRDEVDVCEGGGVFYIGTIQSLTEAKFVRNFASSGDIKIHCSDPYKYSVKVFEQTAVKLDKNSYVFNID